MIRRLVRRLRFGERTVRACDVQGGDRVLDVRGWKEVLRVTLSMGTAIIVYRRGQRYAHFDAPMLVRR